MLTLAQVPMRLVSVTSDAVHIVSPAGRAVLTTALLPLSSPTITSTAYLPTNSKTQHCSVNVCMCMCVCLFLRVCLASSDRTDQLIVLTDAGALNVFDTMVKPCTLVTVLTADKLKEEEGDKLGQSTQSIDRLAARSGVLIVLIIIIIGCAGRYMCLAVYEMVLDEV